MGSDNSSDRVDQLLLNRCRRTTACAGFSKSVPFFPHYETAIYLEYSRSGMRVAIQGGEEHSTCANIRFRVECLAFAFSHLFRNTIPYLTRHPIVPIILNRQ